MSTLKVNTLEEATAGGATFFTAKAWVNFNGTGTVSINADGNVSSITDLGSAYYRANFTNAITDANYSATGLGEGVSTSKGGAVFKRNGTAATTTNFTMNTIEIDGAPVYVDMPYVCVSFTR